MFWDYLSGSQQYLINLESEGGRGRIKMQISEI